jgi:hypothetical protein
MPAGIDLTATTSIAPVAITAGLLVGSQNEKSDGEATRSVGVKRWYESEKQLRSKRTRYGCAGTVTEKQRPTCPRDANLSKHGSLRRNSSRLHSL